jgi:hypothetical protein
VVCDHQVGAGIAGPLEQLEVSRDAGRDLAYALPPGDLQAVRPVVVEGRDVEQLVAEGDDLVAACDPATLRCSAMDDPPASEARSEFIDSLMDTELYSIGAYFCDEHPDLVDQVVAASVEIEGAGLEHYAASRDAALEETFEVLLTGLAVRYYKAVAG